jgi:hypothetical protein
MKASFWFVAVIGLIMFLHIFIFSGWDRAEPIDKAYQGITDDMGYKIIDMLGKVVEEQQKTNNLLNKIYNENRQIRRILQDTK